MSKSFGIIGLGMIADIHAQAIEALGDAGVLTACVSRNTKKVEQFSRTYGCRGYTDLKQFLADPNLDIVTICTPSGTHLESAVASAEAGKHLIVEKPLEINLQRCDRMIEAADRCGVKLCGIFPSRFHEVSRVIREAIDSGRFGKLVLADAYVKWFRTQEYYDRSDWKGTWALDGGGALMNQSIHAIDLLQWLMGPVSEVAAFTGTLAHDLIEVEDTAVASLRFANGALGVIEGSTGVYPGYLKRIEIAGSRGSVIMEEEDILHWDFERELPGDERIRKEFSRKTKTGGGASDPTAIGFHGHQHQFANMIKAIEEGIPLEIDGYEARKAVEIIQAVYRSAETKKSVKLPL